MTETEYARKLEELDRLLNDPDVPMEPARVWSLLAEIAQKDASGGRAMACDGFPSPSVAPLAAPPLKLGTVGPTG
jgi:hypothetical protein